MSKEHTLSVDDLWSLDRVGAPSLSPDGAWVVCAVTTPSMAQNKSSSALWRFATRGADALQGAPATPPQRLTHAGDSDAHPAYAPNGRSIAFTAKREQGNVKDTEPQIYLLDAQGGEAHRAANVPTGVEAFKWFPDSQRMAFVSWVWPDVKGAQAQSKRHKAWVDRKETGYATSDVVYRYWDSNLPMGRVPHLCVLHPPTREGAHPKVEDLFEGTALELTRAEPSATCFDVAPDNRRIAFAFDPAAVKKLDNCFALGEIKLQGKDRSVAVLAQDKAWDFSSPCYSPDGRNLAFIGVNLGRSHTAPPQLLLLDRQTGHWRVCMPKWDREVEGPLRFGPDGQCIYFQAEDEGRRHAWRFDLGAKLPTRVADGAWVESFDVAGDTLAYVINSASHPGRLMARGIASGAPHRLDGFNDALLAQRATGRVESRWIEGARGDRVQVWITYPPEFDAPHTSTKRAKAKSWPLLHVIHGGPHTTFGDGWHFRWNAQVFAAQGYVVVAVNYHGSSSFGHAFKDAISHRWGTLELQDIEAATTALLKEPWVDRQRVYATGGSYGGYMVAWMNGHVKPGRYAAYVCHAGCYDWQAMMADDAYTWFPKELGAWHWADPRKVASQSPSTFASNFKTPTLVIHGAQDFRVPDAQGLAYYNTLKALNVPARLLWFADESHWILKPRNSKQWYGEFFAWLKQHPARGLPKPGPSRPKKP